MYKNWFMGVEALPNLGLCDNDELRKLTFNFSMSPKLSLTQFHLRFNMFENLKKVDTTLVEAQAEVWIEIGAKPDTDVIDSLQLLQTVVLQFVFQIQSMPVVLINIHK